MPGYTLKNFDAIDDMLADRDVEIDVRFARKHIDSNEIGVSLFRYAPGIRSPFAHSHREQEEVYVVTSGSGRVKLDDDIIDLHVRDVLRVAPEVVRQFESGTDGLEILAIGGTRPEDGDGVPVPDWWTD